MLSYQPHLIVEYMVYFLVVWFFIASFSKGEQKINLVIFIMYLVNTWWFQPIPYDYLSTEYRDQYIANKEFLVLIDVFFGLLMLGVSMNKLNTYLAKQYAILSFAVLCHCMLLWDKTISQSFITGFFYTYYDELIIIVGILQVWVSRGGILGVIGRLQDFDYRIFIHNIRSNKTIHK